MSKRAIIAYDGRQFSCVEGDVITVNGISDAIGTKVVFDRVIACVDADSIAVGAKVKNGTVNATVERHERLPKVVSRKYRRRKSSRSQYAHRQPVTHLKIVSIKC